MDVLEKILEEIKQEKLKHWDSSERLETDKLIGWCFDKCTDIIRKHMNDGWISVEERMPTKQECEKDNNEFLVQTDTGERFSCEYDPLSNGYDNPLWRCNVSVVAWQPLPEPYRPERGHEE